MVDIEKIQKKYAMDSKGAFGNEKNPMKKHEMRQAAKASPDVAELKKEYERVVSLKNEAYKVFSSFSRSRNQGPAIKKAYQDMLRSIDRLWAVIEQRGFRIGADKT